MSQQGFTRHNLDGLVAVDGNGSAPPRSYTQLFRDGSIEAVEVYLGFTEGLLFGQQLEKRFAEHCSRYASTLRQLRVDAPLAVSMSLLQVDGCRLVRERHGPTRPGFDRSDVLLPEVIIETDEVTPAQLRPLFDVMWQASGWERSPSFTDTGDWKPSR